MSLALPELPERFRAVTALYGELHRVASRLLRGERTEHPLQTTALMQVKTDTAPVALLDLNAALDALADEDRPLAQLVEMRCFGGMTAEQTAEAPGKSVHIVRPAPGSSLAMPEIEQVTRNVATKPAGGYSTRDILTAWFPLARFCPDCSQPC